jgi:hypothetical protein
MFLSYAGSVFSISPPPSNLLRGVRGCRTGRYDSPMGRAPSVFIQLIGRKLIDSIRFGETLEQAM